MSTRDVNEIRSPPKGILSLIARINPNDDIDSYNLVYFPQNRNATRMKRIRRQEKMRSHSSNVATLPDLISIAGMKSYHPSDTEFTLIFFCALDCPNSRRFTFILANFLKDALVSEMNNTFQLICVLNDDIHQTKPRKLENGSIISHLQSETELWHLGYDHINRLAILRMLSVTRIPSLVVIDNKTGRPITSQGMEAIEWCSEGQSSLVFSKWRDGNSAVPLSASLSQICTLS